MNVADELDIEAIDIEESFADAPAGGAEPKQYTAILRELYKRDSDRSDIRLPTSAVAEAECNTVTGLKQVHHAATPLLLS